MDKRYAQQIASGFMALLDGTEQRRVRAETERNYIIAYLRNDKLPIANRTTWLKSASHKLKQFLIKEATDFNSQYPDDEMLVQDWVDLLNTVRSQLYKGSK
jgi:hypothetical protein